ncbi:hypothetical protein BvCmsB5655_03552 [Escherichia coli]|nr:hypothetical protein BvCmsB5655_03552 [Escherichia coli]
MKSLAYYSSALVGTLIAALLVTYLFFMVI